MLQYQEQQKMNGERFHVKRGSLSFSTDLIRMELAPGEPGEGSFTIYGAEGRAAAGFVLSSEIPMKVLTKEFSGVREMIGYRFDARDFAVGDKVEGVFRIISDQGEYTLPYCILIQAKTLQSSLGPVRSLTHFTNLARSNWQEAVGVFYQKEFRDVIAAEKEGDGKKLLTLYRGLSARNGNEHNVEEFLIAAGKKLPVEFSCETREISVELTYAETSLLYRQIRVRRSGWGYTRVGVQVTGDFLGADKFYLGDADFQGGNAVLSVAMDPSRMHAGRNFGHIVLTPAYGDSVCVPVTVAYCMNTALRTLHRREQHQVILQMMQEYISFRSKKCSGKEFADHMGALIRRLYEIDRNNPLTSLYKIHYLLTLHQEEEALWELQGLNARMSGLDKALPIFDVTQYSLEDDTTYAYRMYLTILCAESQVDGGTQAERAVTEAIRKIEEKHKRNPGNFWITWLLLYADADYARRPAQMEQMLRREYEQGSRSPVLFMEAYLMFLGSPSSLSQLGDFELQVLLFAARYGMLTENVITQINYLAIRRKTFTERLFKVLKKAYELKLPDVTKREILESICTLLIRGNQTEEVYFPWYQKGVEQGLEITRLLDYYMLSLPADFHEELPQIVLLYYAYQNSLPYTQRACLYRYVLAHKEEQQELYEQYAVRIDEFTLEQLKLHRFSDDLAFLYDAYLSSGRALSDEIAADVVPLVFSMDVETKRMDVHRVILVYEKLGTEQICPLENGKGCFSIYGDENQIFAEDDAGNRYVHSSLIHTKRKMDFERLSRVLCQYEAASFGFDLYLSGERYSYYPVNKKNAEQYRRLIENEELSEEYRAKLRAELLTFYEGEDDTGHIKRVLGRVKAKGMNAPERGEMIRYMTVQGVFDKACRWVCRFGTQGVEGDALLRLAGGLLAEGDSLEDEILGEIAHAAFAQGKYDSKILKYLADFWDGRTKEMEEIRTAMLSFGLEDADIARRMLLQMLYTGEDVSSRQELIESCRKNGAGNEFLADVLAQSSHFAFVQSSPMPESAYAMIGNFGMDSVPLLDICRIAWLKNRAQKAGEITEKELEIAELFLTDLLDRGVVFPFFRQFIGVLPGLQGFADETLFEYRSGRYDPKAKILFHYALERDGVRAPYAVREMKEMYEGVYVTGFLLFFGEQLHYFITDDPKEKNVVESGTLGQDARSAQTGKDRFGEINEIAMLTALGRDEEAIGKLENYNRRAYLTKRIFGGT